ncbi:hypothetical protein CYLTODRAFT_103014 [Cylindrobasidium torrendii FP15055 ss-10]|uniref:C2H2-type domain-containing protein n=1 Tax=Cylindrobasidium torrendii FP15055 ss-10 TaxID=1314674 RepID=A0A0D7BNA3_9AGAR|nr:hypothetical protein CYLTODRAFT_103014 [Cylindrobasidium torrendii FP15055 ss-10]
MRRVRCARRGFGHTRRLLRIMSAEMHFVCALDTCIEVFDDAEGLREHFRADARAHCFCEVCDIKFGSPVALVQHERDHSSHRSENTEGDKPSYCGPCERQFKDNIALHQHLQSSHFFCFECSAYFETNKAMKQHSHWSSFAHKKRTLSCPKCDGKFKLVSSLLDHWVVKHVPEHGSRSQLQEAAISAGVPPSLLFPYCIPNQGSRTRIRETL